MIKYSAIIPFGQIETIKIYNNPVRNGRRKTLEQVQKETGADYIINGTLYNMRTGKAVCPLKYDGHVYCETLDKYTGYSWDKYDPASFHLQVVPDDSKSNYIACSCLIKDWQCVKQPIYNSAQGGKRGRTCIGTTVINKERALCLFVSDDRYCTAKYTPYTLATNLQAEGWQDCVMLDCGSSSQGYFKGIYIKNSRRCANYICIKLKKEGKKHG